MRNHTRRGSGAAAVLTAAATAAAVLSGAGTAGAADQDPVYTCQFVLADDINRVAGADCTGGPAGYEGSGTIKSADSATVWQCALLGSAADPERPGKLTVVGVFGCEQPSSDVPF